jgi:polyisoprenoid-binding protein YceI
MLRSLSTVALALGLAAGSAHAATPGYGRVLPGSSVSFSATQMGVAMRGEFHTVQVQAAFAPANPAQSRLSVSVASASVDAGSSDTNALLSGVDWLDAQHFPNARFVSTAFSADGAGRYWVSGQFTVKGRTQALRVLATTHPSGANLALDADFNLDRSAWALGTGAWADTSVVAAALPIHVHLLLAPQP